MIGIGCGISLVAGEVCGRLYASKLLNANQDHQENFFKNLRFYFVSVSAGDKF